MEGCLGKIEYQEKALCHEKYNNFRQERVGSNDIDFPIPNSFKIDLRNSNYIDTVNYLINDSIENYEAKIKLFENYKEKLILEKEIFYKNTKKFF